MIYHATTKMNIDGAEETFHWVSLDDEHFLPVNRPPDPEIGIYEEIAIKRLFEGNGNFKPMTFAKRYLVGEGAVFSEPI